MRRAERSPTFFLLPISYFLFPRMLLAADPASPTQQQLEAMSARFAPVDIGADVSALPASERQALAKLVEASQLIDAIFLRQVWAGQRGDADASSRPISRRSAARGCTTSC